tara:strand:- start:923 stop:1087 length:165 start_codon:yes stop_codon:yes gene_type:complete
VQADLVPPPGSSPVTRSPSTTDIGVATEDARRRVALLALHCCFSKKAWAKKTFC